jgi:adenosylmethionine-8-amino-7-oxononanoate aminotransferase
MAKAVAAIHNPRMRKLDRTHTVSTRLPKVSHGEGCYVTDMAGRRYLDGSGGPAVFSLGHAHPEVNTAIRQQLDRIAHGYRYSFSSDPLERLTALIQQQAGPGADDILFVSSGSEAVESALKIALQYHHVCGESQRTRFIARERSYHGNTLGALSVSGFAQRRRQFEGALPPCSFVSPANEYRPVIDGDTGELVDYLAGELRREIECIGAENLAAFIFEPVVGAAGGVVPAPAGYAHRVREICDESGILMIADEVMCGSARCGSWRALEHDGVVADITAIGKGLGGGYVPLGAVLYAGGIGAPIHEIDGSPNTGHTFTGHTLACAAAARVQEIVIRDSLSERVRKLGPVLMRNLQDAIGDLDAVGDIRGRGFLIGVELVADHETRRPFDAALHVTEAVREATLASGLICYPVSGTIDGIAGDVVIISPPYNAGEVVLDELVERFSAGLRQALVAVGAG